MEANITAPALYAFLGACIGGALALTGTLVNAWITSLGKRRERRRARLELLYREVDQLSQRWIRAHTKIAALINDETPSKSSLPPLKDDFTDLHSTASLYFPDVAKTLDDVFADMVDYMATASSLLSDADSITAESAEIRTAEIQQHYIKIRDKLARLKDIIRKKSKD